MPLNIGAFLGGNNGQGGIAAQLQQQQQQRAKQREQAAAIQALSALSQKGLTQGLPSQPGAPMPGGAAPPMGPGMTGAATQPGPAQGGGAMPPAAPPPAGGLSPRPNDPMALQFGLIDRVMSNKNLSDDEKFQALGMAQATSTPLEQYMQKMELAQQKAEFTAQMAAERYQNAKDIANMRVTAQERGQDLNAENVGKRVTAQERGQDTRSTTADEDRVVKRQRADTQDRATGSKIIQGEEGLKIKQQNADTASDRAGTYKYGTMENTQLKETAQKSKDKLDAAKIAKMEKYVASEDKKPFQAAKDKYDKAASLYQTLMRPGVTPAANPEDVKFAKDKMDAAQAEMERLSSSGAEPAAKIAPDDPRITPENLQHTADKYGITVDEVKKKLGIQ